MTAWKLASHGNCWGGLGGMRLASPRSRSLALAPYATWTAPVRISPHLGVGGGAKRFDGTREPDYRKLGAELDRVKALAESRGLRAHYHPHLSPIVEGAAEVANIFDLTAIDFWPDTAHLAAAGGDPAQLIRDHVARISYVHLKRFQRAPCAFTPMDRGDVPTGPILQAMKDLGFEGWVCTELDSWPDPAEGARLSMDYLNRWPTTRRKPCHFSGRRTKC